MSSTSNLKSVLAFLIFILILSCNKGEKKGKIKKVSFNTNIQFSKKEHAFGVIKKNKTVKAIFNFKNTGKNPLVIHHVKSSCGCTIPKWPMNEIKINETDSLTVIYDAEQIGNFRKTITVFYNGDSSPQKLLIEGKVIK